VVLLLTAAACQPTCSPPAATPVASPSSSPSSSPAPSSSAVAVATPSTSPSAAASPVGSTLAITSLPFHGGEVGIQYAPISLGASGGKPPYQWSITDGQFPPGLTLSTGGSVSGTDSAGGRFDFTVHVVDFAGAAANLGSSVQIYSPLVTAAYCAGQCAVEDGCTNACGVFGGASGGLGPYGYTITAGGAPPGMGLSGLTLTGTFQAGGAGAYNLTVVVSDQYGAQGTVPANWYVFPHIAFTVSNAICTGSYNGGGGGCTTQQLQYAGGTPNGTATGVITQDLAKYPPLPAGTKVAASGGIVTFTVPTPGCTFANGFFSIVTVVLADQSPCGSGNCSSGPATVTIRMSNGC
jgi:hypothetical protein